MSKTHFQTDQVETIFALDEIGPTVGTELATVLQNTNARFKDPFALSFTGASTVLSVGSSSPQIGPNGKVKTLPPLNGTDLSSLSGTIDFSTAAVTGDAIAPTLPNMNSNYFVRVGIEVRSDKKIYAVFGAQAISLAAAGYPTLTSDAYPLGIVALQANSTGGIGAFLNPTNAGVVQFASGGNGLSSAVRSRLGIQGSGYEAYANALTILSADSYASAISKLDSTLYSVLTSAPQEDRFLITASAGVNSITSPNTAWSANNTDLDIVVRWNGKVLTQDTTGGTGYDFKKTSANTIQFTGIIPKNAEIVIRKERTGGSSSGSGGSAVAVKKDAITIVATAQVINFTGAGVSASDAGSGQVNVNVPGAGSVFNIVKSYRNLTGSTILAGKAVSFQDDGSIALSDVSVFSLSDFVGITGASIADSAYGSVTKLGNCPGILTGFSAVPGQKVYLDDTPGELTLTPSTDPAVSVILLGSAEPPDGVQQAGCTDLFLSPHVISEP